ncbi:hypothetical protein [Reichenbachiella sp. MALMAid0571]|uniref:hypothetical protein n=1 Tax=Reichenbachiella sp. MALMAid0571 TaxID=3143939 RepID=UPI0032DF75B6
MFILKTTSWQIFLMVFLPLMISAIVTDFLIGSILEIISYNILFGWFLLVGKNLNEQLNDDEIRPDTFFIINCFYLIVFSSIASIMNNGRESEMPMIVLLLTVYFAFAFFYVVYFTAQSFLSMQEIKSRKSSQYSDQLVFLYFFIFIVGIWFIQPRINEYFKS